MSTAPAQGQHGPNQITVISHSALFYWWPVWAVGFLMGIATYFEHTRLATVSADAELLHDATVLPKETAGEARQLKGRSVIVQPEGKDFPGHNQLKLHMTGRAAYGAFWATVLLLVIVITNVPLRGLWSVVIIVTIILLSIIFALADWWTIIFSYLFLLDVRINTGGYFFISGVLFGIWLVTLLIFDRQVYIVFTPGQMKVCTEIGGGEKVFDTTGMRLEKQRSDLFRHWILGLGSGDLVVRTAGAAAEHFDLHNVLFIGKKVEQIEEMLKRRQVVDIAQK
jgi:hypothetical protein